jgi:hypothetical protein
MKWLEPWEAVRNSMDEVYLVGWESELMRETGPEHPLYQANAKLIARRFDCDDALFQLDDGRVALVHLTWSGKRERDPRCPDTVMYESLEAWEQSSLAVDHADWVLSGG